jgi:vitamin B12 transporter
MIGAYFDATASTRVRGSYAHKVRFPTLRQLYGPDEGNTDLQAESSNNYELAVEQILPGNSMVTLTGFYIDVKDYIEKIPPTDTFQNNDNYLFKGIELTAETRFIQNMLLRVGYTYMETEDKSPDTEREELQYRPEHKLTFEAQYRFTFGLSAYGSVQHVANQYYYSRREPLEKDKLNDITTVNIKLDQALFKGQLHLFVGADNLFDADYEESYAYPAPGRYLYCGAEIYF